jgi:L-ribulose-5-phosphate 4-epimerase
MTQEIQQLKEQVCQANLDLVAHGLVTLTWGNASGLTADRKSLVIKPSGIPYRELRPELMVIVNIETGCVVDGSLKPSSDTPTHAVLYRNFNGVGGIVHTHSPRATSFAQAGRAIPCLGTTHADHFHGEVPVTRSLTQTEVESAYELKTGEVIVERFASLDPAAVPAVLVAGHASFTWGYDVNVAVNNAVALEAVADMALCTLTLHSNAKPLDAFLLDKHYRRKHGTDAYYGQQ